MIERVFIALALAVLGYLMYRLYTRRQIGKAVVMMNSDPVLANRKPGVPTIVYFSTPTCGPCRLQQTPILDQLRREMGDEGLRLICVDATEDPDIADQWGVFSVPTLFVLDAQGQPRSVFNGVVGLEKLKQELQAS
jgi:thioredoxin-like negative regulator of GroEL